MKTVKGKSQRAEGRRQRIDEESENRGGVRRKRAAMNCTGKRSFGERSTLSPKKLNRARKVAGSQKVKGISKNKEARIKAARMPIPPPFGIGIGIS